VKVVTVLGTRPEIIRLCLIIPKLDRFTEHVLVNTGQNYHDSLNRLFFEQLSVRAADYDLGVRGASMSEQVAGILQGCEDVLRRERPDRLLVLGDTNSGLAAYVAKRLGIEVYHMEAGNRCFDDRVPEEVNRRVIDHCSDVLIPYTERSRQNLLREGIPAQRIFVSGNPIFEVIEHFREPIERSDVLRRLRLERKGYYLVTMHRAENVDLEERLRLLTESLRTLAASHAVPVVVSTHPRTRAKMEQFDVRSGDSGVVFAEPFGFLDFVNLEMNARCVLSDSGTVQEECTILGVPAVTLRDVTERPETLECGSNILSGADPDTVRACVEAALDLSGRWRAPPEYLVENVSDTIVRLLRGFRRRDTVES